MRFSILIISLFIFVMVSCNDGNNCYDSTNTVMVASFTIDGGKQIKTLVINGVNRNNIDDRLVNDTSSTLTKRYALPLSLSADSTGFVINSNSLKDTLYIRHTMIMGFISENCGFAPNYVISGFRFTKGIDSVKISDAQVNPNSIAKITNDQNISIYFSTAH
jgi:hypothetical protein